MRKRTAGFTLIEMLVVVVVIGLLATMLVIQFQRTNRGFELENAKSIIVVDIRTMMTWAQTGKTCCTSSTVPEGYGIVFRSSRTFYQSYAEFDGDLHYSAGGSDEIIDSIDLATDELIEHVQIASCTPVAASSTRCDLFIEHPSGRVYINGAQTDDLLMTIQQTETNETDTITVDVDSGQVN